MRSRRRGLGFNWLDAAVWVAGLLVVFLVVFLAYSMWAERQRSRELGRAGRAVAALVEVVRKDPGNVKARVKLAEALAAAGRVAQASEQYQEVLKLEKDNASALVGLGLIAMRQQQYSTAQGYWDRVIDKLAKTEYAGSDGRLEMAYYYMGVAYLEQRQYEEAVPYLKQASRIRRGYSDTHYMLSIAYKGLGYEDKQREELRIALMFDPKMPEANFDVGMLLLADGDVAGAAEAFRIAVDNAENNDKPLQQLEKLGEAQQYVAKATQLSSSEPKKALDNARIAVALDPSATEAVRLLAALFEKNGKPAEARKTYDMLLRLVPEDKGAQDAVKRLGAAKNG